MPTYLPNETYDLIIARLKAAVLDLPATGHMDYENVIMEVLGEVGNIWPASIEPEQAIVAD